MTKVTDPHPHSAKTNRAVSAQFCNVRAVDPYSTFLSVLHRAVDPNSKFISNTELWIPTVNLYPTQSVDPCIFVI